MRIAADGSTDELYAAAMQVYELHGQRVALSVRGVPLPQGVPVQQQMGLVLAAAQDDRVLVTAAPQLTVQEIYGLPIEGAGDGAGGGPERDSEQGGRSVVDEGGRDLAAAFARKLGKLGRGGEANGEGEAAAEHERRTSMFGSPDKVRAAAAAPQLFYRRQVKRGERKETAKAKRPHPAYSGTGKLIVRIYEIGAAWAFLSIVPVRGHAGDGVCNSRVTDS